MSASMSHPLPNRKVKHRGRESMGGGGLAGRWYPGLNNFTPHGGAGDAKRRDVGVGRNVAPCAQEDERWGMIHVGDLEMKNNDASGQYSVVNAVEWMAQCGHSRHAEIHPTWCEKSNCGDGLVCLSMTQTRIDVNSSWTSK
jgi:hypothetical protein